MLSSATIVEYDFGRRYPGGFQQKTDIKKIADREIQNLLAGLKASQNNNKFRDQMLQHLLAVQQSEPRWQSPGCTNDVLFEASCQVLLCQW